jgi:CPA2 family monovalent cation:H+ antiporter-2
MTGLELTLLYLVAAVLGVALFRALSMPPMLGYLAVGVVIGPNALALAGDTSGMQHLAEFGVVFLMFSIGLEFSLGQLKAMRSLVFGLGAAQMLSTLAVVLLASLAFAWFMPKFWSQPIAAGIALGGAFAMSSTAIVVKLLAEKIELDSPHGRHIIGVLLFQDLAVVPLLILIPAMASHSSDLSWLLTLALIKAVLVLAVILLAGGRLLQPWLRIVVKRKSDELFMLNLLLLTLGLAWITEMAGLSMALGAFLAGMLIAETPYKAQVEADIRPFRDVLLGLFFITIGMLLDWRLVLAQWWLVLLLAVLPPLVKAALVFGIERLRKTPPGLSLRVALWLAPAGEFGIVLINIASGNKLIPPEVLNPVLAAMVISMLYTPLLGQYIDRIVLKVSSADWMLASLQLTNIARSSIKAQNHVIICGFGRCGQNLARLLDTEHIAHLALDLDPDRVAQTKAAGQNVVYGDSTRLATLQAAGLQRASALVITYVETHSALRILHLMREHAPHVPVVVRTMDDGPLEELRQAGAAEVVPEILEGSLMLASHTLALVGVPLPRVLKRVRHARAQRYGLLRDWFHGSDDASLEDADQPRLQSITLTAEAAAVGQMLRAVSREGARVTQVRRSNGQVLKPAPTLLLQEGDTVVLSGLPDALAVAEEALLRG